MLHIIPTPIGNREDITLRALKLLKECEIFLCEDTRTFQKLLSMYDIPSKGKKLYALTSFTSEASLDFYTKLISENEVGLVSENGTPWLSDPGKELVKLCRLHDLKFEVLPWANALIPAIVSSNFDTSSFSYQGFLPTKKGRQTALKKILASSDPVFIYESVHRIEKLLNELDILWFKGRLLIIREISKMFEQKIFGTTTEIAEMIKSKKFTIKWEFVVGIIND